MKATTQIFVPYFSIGRIARPISPSRGNVSEKGGIKERVPIRRIIAVKNMYRGLRGSSMMPYCMRPLPRQKKTSFTAEERRPCSSMAKRFIFGMGKLGRSEMRLGPNKSRPLAASITHFRNGQRASRMDRRWCLMGGIWWMHEEKSRRFNSFRKRILCLQISK